MTAHPIITRSPSAARAKNSGAAAAATAAAVTSGSSCRGAVSVISRDIQRRPTIEGHGVCVQKHGPLL